MRYPLGKTVVVALGGSVVHPDGIDINFLKKFKRFLAPLLRRGTKFVLVVGGGKLARRFQDAAGMVARLTDDDKDWLGIHATRLNAHLLRTIFCDVADPVVIDERHRLKAFRYPVTVAAGWRPGWSTDYVAVRLALDFGIREAVIAGAPAHVYEKDPAKHPSAKRFSTLTWRDYRKLIPRKWRPGLHAPVDPVAAALAAKGKMRAVIINGRDLRNFQNFLNGKQFRGTVIG